MLAIDYDHGCNAYGIEPERRLWCAIIKLAIADLSDPDPCLRRRARWFLEGPNLRHVGLLAGLEPEALEAIQNSIKTGSLTLETVKRVECMHLNSERHPRAHPRKKNEGGPLIYHGSVKEA